MFKEKKKNWEILPIIHHHKDTLDNILNSLYPEFIDFIITPNIMTCNTLRFELSLVYIIEKIY